MIVGLSHILGDRPVDLVLSGVNRGRNSAEDSMYSGTLGGAMEGALNGVRAIGLSQAYEAPVRDPKDGAFWSAAEGWGLQLVRDLVEKAPWGPDVFYSVNFPARTSDKVEGVRVAPSGRREGPAFVASQTQAPNGRSYYWLSHRTGVERSSREGGDDRAHAEGWIAVTPMRPDLTAQDLLVPARDAFR